jgi:hypothetical protein
VSEPAFEIYRSYDRGLVEEYLEVTDDPVALFRALPLAVGLGLFAWGLLAATAYGIYLLVA